MNNPGSDTNFFYDMTQQQQQNIASSSRQSISKNVLKKHEEKLIFVKNTTVMQKIRLKTF